MHTEDLYLQQAPYGALMMLKKPALGCWHLQDHADLNYPLT